MPASFSPIFDNASSQAAAISGLFKVVLVICGVILVIVTSMVGVSLIRFRQRTDEGEPRPYFGKPRLTECACWRSALGLNIIYGGTAVVAFAMSVLSFVVTRKPSAPA